MFGRLGYAGRIVKSPGGGPAAGVLVEQDDVGHNLDTHPVPVGGCQSQGCLGMAAAEASRQVAPDSFIVCRSWPGDTAPKQRRQAYREGIVIGLFQTLALLAGISRSGVTMVAGLLRGLDHEDAAKFSFLLATPVILAAGLLKLPSLAGPAAADIHGQVLAGALTAGIAAYASVRFLTRYFTTRTLTPFAIYSLVVGSACILWFATTGG